MNLDKPAEYVEYVIKIVEIRFDMVHFAQKHVSRSRYLNACW